MAYPVGGWRIPAGEAKPKKLMIAAYNYAANGKRIPWSLELHRYCQAYNALPNTGGILEQDPYTLAAMTVASAGFATGIKDAKDYEEGDWSIRRLVDVTKLLSERPSRAQLTKRLTRICGEEILAGGELDAELAIRLGIGDCVTEIEDILNGNR